MIVGGHNPVPQTCPDPNALQTLLNDISRLQKDTNHSPDRRILARRAIRLAGRLQEKENARQRRVAVEVLQLASEIITSVRDNNIIQETDQAFAKFVDNKSLSDEAVHTYIQDLRRSIPGKASPMDGLHEAIVCIRDDNKLDQLKRDLADAALELVESLGHQSVPGIQGVQSDILELAQTAIFSDYRVEELILLFYNLANSPVEDVKTNLTEQQNALAYSDNSKHPGKGKPKAPTRTDRVEQPSIPRYASAPSSAAGGGQMKQPNVSKSQISGAILYEEKGGKTTYGLNADAISRKGHDFIFGATRKLPDNLQDLTITERYQDHETVVNGKRDDRIGHIFAYD